VSKGLRTPATRHDATPVAEVRSLVGFYCFEACVRTLAFVADGRRALLFTVAQTAVVSAWCGVASLMKALTLPKHQ